VIATAWWSDQVALMPNVGRLVNRVHMAIGGACVAVPSFNPSLGLMRYGEMTVKDMIPASTTPLKSGYESQCGHFLL